MFPFRGAAPGISRGKDLSSGEAPGSKAWRMVLVFLAATSPRAHGDVVLQQGIDEIDRHLVIQIASEYKNRDAQWLSDKWRDTSGSGANVVRTSLVSPDVSPRSPPRRSPSAQGCGNGLHAGSPGRTTRSARISAAYRHYMGGHTTWTSVLHDLLQGGTGAGMPDL